MGVTVLTFEIWGTQTPLSGSILLSIKAQLWNCSLLSRHYKKQFRDVGEIEKPMWWASLDTEELFCFMLLPNLFKLCNFCWRGCHSCWRHNRHYLTSWLLLLFLNIFPTLRFSLFLVGLVFGVNRFYRC